jgi:mannose-6-phosphate isomerase-like protein (cupin superfamily)
MPRTWASLILPISFAATPVVAQRASTSASMRGATVTAAEIAASVRRADTATVADTVLRVLSINDEYNVGISVVRRSQVNGRTPPDAIVHDAITEVYHILEGRGVLVTGGTVDNATPLAADHPVVRYVAGPSAVGQTISSGRRQAVGPGDIVVIPPHTAHGFVEIRTPRIVYALVRIDSHRVLEAREPPR